MRGKSLTSTRAWQCIVFLIGTAESLTVWSLEIWSAFEKIVTLRKIITRQMLALDRSFVIYFKLYFKINSNALFKAWRQLFHRISITLRSWKLLCDFIDRPFENRTLLSCVYARAATTRVSATRYTVTQRSRRYWLITQPIEIRADVSNRKKKKILSLIFSYLSKTKLLKGINFLWKFAAPFAIRIVKIDTTCNLTLFSFSLFFRILCSLANAPSRIKKIIPFKLRILPSFPITELPSSEMK